MTNQADVIQNFYQLVVSPVTELVTSMSSCPCQAQYAHDELVPAESSSSQRRHCTNSSRAP